VAALTELIARLDELLEPERFDDYGPNGLQVPGREEVAVVVTGVSAGRELFERAIAAGGGLVLTHHGLFWKNLPLAIDRPGKARLQLLFDNDVSLAAYHLPLDAHLEHGNNALLAAALGAELITPFPTGAGTPIGVIAHLPGDGLSPAELQERTTAAAGGREPLAFLAGPDRVRTVGIVSGGGSPYLRDAIAQGLDAFLTGEPTEWVMLLAQEHGIHFLAAGHYATETLGVRRLGDLLAAEFGVEHTCIDVPNPI
jgi:dinuclear metal center YbgI/SA1388 family protein